jgi:putative tricarboxylic transport membrane protein
VVKVLTIPQPIIIAIVVLFCVVGAYAERNSFADVGMILLFGVIGYLFDKFGFPIAPMVLGTILGPLTETSFLRSMIRYDNDWTTFFRRPISCKLLVLAIAPFLFPLLSRLKRQRSPVPFRL